VRAHHGYEDGSGRYLITVDTERCSGCEECVRVCPESVLAMVEEDPLEERRVAAVGEEHRHTLREDCAPCKGAGCAAPPCVACCAPGALEHSW
jgi:Fe-S-cluster-containing dehydrogenase component